MKKYIIFLIISLFSANMLFAEIKMVQIQVMDTPDPQSKYLRLVNGGFAMTDQTSYMLPVSKKRVQGNRMPFINKYGHDVLLVGPFLDMCGDIEIIESGSVIAKIKTSEFVARGIRNFYFPNENRSRNEGCVHFRIPLEIIRSIRSTLFQIKVGNIENLDVLECQLVKRYEIQAMLFLDGQPNLPTRELTTHNGFQTVKNVFQKSDRPVRLAIKLKGNDIPSTEIFRFGNGTNKDFLYQFDNAVAGKSCKSNLEVTGGVKIGSLIGKDDAIFIEVTPNKDGGKNLRRNNDGYMISLSDGKMGQFTKVNMNSDAVAPSPGTTFSKTQQPDNWGPYIFARMMPDVYTMGRYTDFGIVEIGECGATPGKGGFSGTTDNTANPYFPDLTPIPVRNIYRGSLDNFCNGITTINQKKDVVQANIKWGVQNITNIPVTSKFTIELRSGNDLLSTQEIEALPPFGIAEFEFVRKESKICIQRTKTSSSGTPVCVQCDPIVSKIPLWTDPEFRVTVDVNLIIDEGESESNNRQIF